MKTSGVKAAIRDLQALFGVGALGTLADGPLLDRFVERREEAVFEAIIQRHGAMVWGVCRRVLRDHHDAEDAFQATFLVLARRAVSVMPRDRLGDWLYGVAYRTAMKAKAMRAKRRRRETTVPDVPESAGMAHDRRDDLTEWLDRDLSHLPEKYRIPIVLCDLEERTHQEAADQLGWPVGTLSGRLSRARAMLAKRLRRRGLAFSGGMLAVMVAQKAASADMPARLIGPTARAASLVTPARLVTAGVVSAEVADLTREVLNAMLLSKLKTFTAIALVGLALAAGGLVVAARTQAAGGRNTQERAGQKMPPAKVAARAPEPAPEEMLEVRGRVVDPDGRPVEGAPLRVQIYDDFAAPPRSTSGPDGRFVLSTPRLPDGSFYGVIATAPGFGMGWVPGRLLASASRAGASGEVVVRLPADSHPIEGRVVDLEGRPVAGAQIRVDRLWAPWDGSLATWIERFRTRGVQGFQDGLAQLPFPMTATTGPDGRARLEGIGPDRIADVTVSGPTIATARLHVMTRDGTDVRSPKQTFAPDVLVARRFEIAAAPTKPIVGTVRDRDTHRPIAGLTLSAVVDRYGPGIALDVRVKTDEQGRYRVSGLPKADAYRLTTEQSPGLPYLFTTRQVTADSPALEPVHHDIALKRAVMVRGRVTDKATGKPVSAIFHAFAFADNPHIGDFPGLYSSHADIQADGRYEIAVMPGRVLMGVLSAGPRYRTGVGAEAIQGFDARRGTFRNVYPFPGYPRSADYNLLTEVNLDPKADSATLDLQLDPGHTVTIAAVDPKGKPIGQTQVQGLNDPVYGGVEPALSPSTFEVQGLDPSRPRRVTIAHAGRKLIGSVYLKGDETSPLAVRLQPWGTITGRLVDDEGKPRAGVVSSAFFLNRKGPDLGLLPGTTPGPGGIPVGRDGRFRIEGLVPGLKYSATVGVDMRIVGALFNEVTVTSGEVKDLGDLKPSPLKPEDLQ
jgi:RNA polymerase sigma factor (sigma-70 family)